MNQTTSPKQARWKRWFGEGLLFLCVFLGVQLWQTRDVPKGQAPQFQGVLASGGDISLNDWRAQHPGQAVLLYFWADWCPICKTVAGNVDKLSKDGPVLTVALQSGTSAQVVKYLEDHHHQWLTVVDEDGRITSRYGFKGVPAFVVIDAAGNIRFVESGYTSEVGLALRLWWVSRFP